MKPGLLAAVGAALGLAGAAQADAPPAKPQTPCFLSRNWSGWHAPNKDTIYLRVNVKDIYRLDLSNGAQLLTWPDSRLVNDIHGPDSICSPIDLDLRVVNDRVVIPLFVKSITKLTPEQVAMIPKKDLP